MSTFEKVLLGIIAVMSFAWYLNTYQYHIPNLANNARIALAGNSRNIKKLDKIHQWAAKLPRGDQWADSIYNESKNSWRYVTVAESKERQRKKDSILRDTLSLVEEKSMIALGEEQTLILTTAELGTNTVEENNGKMNVTSSNDLELGYFKAYKPTCGVRFDGVALPRFSAVQEVGEVGQITEAYIQFTAKAKSGTTTCVVPIFGIDSDDTTVFNIIDSDLLGRVETTATLEWDLTSSSWRAGDNTTEQRTPNLSAIVQEILERTGWANGNAMGFKLKSKTGNTGHRNAASSTHTMYNGPELVVKYKIWEETVNLNN